MHPKTLSAIFLVAGTCTGGGMLALPVATATSGFLPSTVVMLLAWLAMTSSALILCEVALWMPADAHIITMSERFLGKPGKIVAWLLYLFICYASLVAYTSGGGNLLSHASTNLFGIELTTGLGCVIFTLIFGPLIFLGANAIGKANYWLFIAMIIAYIGLIALCVSSVNISYLMHSNWYESFFAVPLLLTAFSFQTMVPSLRPYLDNHAPSMRLAVVAGTTCTLFTYLIWQFVVLGCVPVDGDHGLFAALNKGEAATHCLGHALESQSIGAFASGFAFFALVTSFLGIAFGLVDFLADGLRIDNQGKGKLILAILVIAPSLFLALTYERAFLLALDLTGGFGDAILNGIIPVLMALMGRYVLSLPDSGLRLQGGPSMLLIVGALFVTALCIEIFVRTGHLVPLHDLSDIIAT